jgi:hypothetical protein
MTHFEKLGRQLLGKSPTDYVTRKEIYRAHRARIDAELAEQQRASESRHEDEKSFLLKPPARQKTEYQNGIAI